MSKFKSLMDSSQIEEGDVIDFATQGDAGKKRARPISKGYVHHVIYHPTNKDTVSHFAVLEIVPVKEAEGSAHHIIDMGQAGEALGLPVNQQWAVVLFPLKVTPDKDGLGRSDGLVQRIGNLAQSGEKDRLENRIQDMGGDDRLFFGRGDGPRMARPSEETWGLYIPRGITRRNEADQWAIEESGPKRKYQKKHDFTGKELDVVGLDKLVTVGVLDQETADLFQKPADRRVKPIHSLRAIWKMADKNPEELEKYLPKTADLQETVLLKDIGKDLEDEIHPTVVWGLSSPRDPKKGQKKAPPITTLQEAYKLVTERPEDLKKYNYIGAKMQEYALADIIDAYESRLKGSEGQSDQVLDMARKIKAVWTDMTAAYTGQRKDERFIQDGQPVWELVPKQG